MDDTNANTQTWAIRCVCNVWRWRQHEQKRRPRAHSLVKCRVSCALCWSCLSRRHRCRTSGRSVSPRKRNSKFTSWCYSPTLSCQRQLRLYYMLHIANTGQLECCPHTSRRLQQTAVSCKRSISNKKKSWKPSWEVFDKIQSITGRTVHSRLCLPLAWPSEL